MLKNIRKRNNYFLYYSLLGLILLLFYLVGNYFFPINVDYFGPESNFWIRKYLNGVSTLYYLGCGFLLYGIVRYIIFYISFKKNEKEFVHNQSNNRYLDCRELYLFLGNDYIVKYNNIVKFYKYSDFIWVYVKKNKERKSSFLNIELMMKNGRIISTKNFEHKNFDRIDEVVSYISSMNSDIKIGYTAENIKYFKDKGFKVY